MTDLNHQQLLTHLALVKIDGVDAETFLQGQLTNDVQTLGASWQWNGYCNPKGRLLATMLLWRDQGCFYMLLDASLVEATIKRLRMYVMRSQVQLEILNHAKCVGDLHPDEPSEPSHSAQLPDSTSAVLWLKDRCMRLSFNETSSALASAQQNSSAWLINDIEQGLPWVNALTVEQFIPQMINFDALGGVNFKKGCYTGQEIVARMHYLGKLKQRMFVCDLAESAHSVKPGDKIVSTRDQRAAGTIVTSLMGHRPCLAVLRLDAAQEASLNVVSDTGTVLTSLAIRATQPYALPATKQT